MTNNVQPIKMDDDHRHDSDALLLVDMTEETRNDLLALGVRQNLDEGVRCLCMRVDRLHDLGGLPKLLVQRLDLRAPLHVCLDSLRVAVLVDGGRHGSLVILHLHQSQVDTLDVAQRILAIGNRGLGLRLVACLRAFDVEERSRCLGIAESNLAKATLNNKLLRLGPGLCRLDRTLDLLLHTLHVVVTTSAVPPIAKPIVGLEQVGLGKLVRRLLRVLAWCTTNLTEDLIVEVLGDGSLGASFIDVASRGHQLLQLNAGDEVLVLGCHQAVVLGQLRNLVVALGALRIFFEESCTVGLGQIEKLFGMSDDRERRAPSMLSRSTSSHLALRRSCWDHWLALARQAVGILEDLSRLGGRALWLGSRRRSPLLLRSRLGLLALQDGGLLRRRCLCGLTRQLSMELLLLLLGWSLSLLKLLMLLLRWLLILMLLRALQDLRTVRARETGRHTRWHSLHSLHTRHAGHTGERGLSLIELLLVLLRIAHTRGRLDWRCAAVLVSDTLVSQHGFDLVQAHDLP